MVEVDPEHSVVGVAPRAAEVGTYGTRYGTDRTRRQVPVKEVLCNPQPPMGDRAGHLQPLAAHVFEQHAPEDFVDARVLDEIGVDEVIPIRCDSPVHHRPER